MALGVFGLLALYAFPARADIWGFVDSERIPHFAASRVDERYELLLRESEASEPSRRSTSAAAVVQDDVPDTSAAADSGRATWTLGSAPGKSAASAVPSKMVTLFEQSETYRAVSPLMREASKTHGIDYSLLKAVIATESGFNTHIVSPGGAVGLMQLIPPTAQRYGVTAGKDSTIAKKLTDPKINIRAGAQYLADLIKMFNGRIELALAAYNAGEGAVQKAGNKIPNYPETQKYVKTVMQLYTGLASVSPKVVTGRARIDVSPSSGAPRWASTEVASETP